jgi:hypothetical protein
MGSRRRPAEVLSVRKEGKFIENWKNNEEVDGFGKGCGFYVRETT